MKNKSFSANEIKCYRVTKKEDIKVINEEILEEWKCKICQYLVFDPKICTVCNNPFCNECIQKFMEGQNKYKCINKCQNANIRELNRMEKNYIDNINLRCSHKECTKFIKYNDYKNHLEKYKFRIYHCDNKPCNKEGVLSFIKEHSKICRYRMVPCNLCNMTYRYNNLDNHLKECPQQPVQCVYCDKIMIRNDFQTIHHSENAKCLKKEFNKIKNECEESKKLVKELEKKMEEKDNIINKQKVEINMLRESKNGLVHNEEIKQHSNDDLDKINENKKEPIDRQRNNDKNQDIKNS